MAQEASTSPINGWPDLLKIDAAGPHLVGSRCRDCDYVAFPPLVACPRCLHEDSMRRTALSSSGRLENFTVVHQAPKGFRAPYIQAFVRLPEGVLVFTHIAGCEPREDALQPGQAMRLATSIIKRDERGTPLLGYVFEPMAGGSADA